MRPASLALAAILVMAGYGCTEQPAESEETTTPAESIATSAPDPAAQAAAANPCAWVPVEEVNAIAGSPVTVVAGDTERDCSYRTADEKTKLIVKQWTDVAGYPALAAMSDAEPVEGLGEQAIWMGDTSAVYAVKGGQQIQVTYDESFDVDTPTPAPAKREKAVALARKLIEHL